MSHNRFLGFHVQNLDFTIFSLFNEDFKHFNSEIEDVSRSDI